ncbi:endonuclease domain-containing protein [Candidatus Acetothermia bacterium]|nr:endonuclease domain-containing protein [Candidatus Acetothermia bacterium]
MRWRASVTVQTRARQLRQEMTSAEQKLWRHLRLGQFRGTHFRRQHAVGRFIVDFFCPKAKLVIEIDGDTHAVQAEYDAERTRWLREQKGYRVIRFTNQEVHHYIESVLQRILEALEE